MQLLRVAVYPIGMVALAGRLTAPAKDPTPAKPPVHRIATGIFKPTWESLAQNYRCPEWFRDAKFGIWAHWSAQCVPEQGDWYARHMYIQGTAQYNYHVAQYGHPSKFGFMEIDHLWKAEKWDPEKLMALYKRAGAKYFVALANHHDNFDNYDSKYHAWNSVNVGPRKDLIGIWARVARRYGLRFGVSNHSAHSWHWFQTAYGYDGEGDLAGVRYDAATLTQANGKGTWWKGLDPQQLYTGPNIKMPDGITGARAVQQWHERNDRPWTEAPPSMNPAFTEAWFLRCQDLVDKYHPDLLYFDNTGDLPLGQAGLDIAAHFYNASMQWSDPRKRPDSQTKAAESYYPVQPRRRLDAVLNVKGLDEKRRPGVVEDYERGSSDRIQPFPWQTDTCIGDWHYNRRLYDQHRYKSVGQVVRMLANIVSKNGNLLLSIPVRGDGTLDEDEVAFLEGMGRWMDVNGEAIFATRPWKIFGEGPARSASGMFNENRERYTPQDIRFTTKGDILYAFVLGWPGETPTVIKALGAASPQMTGRRITAVSLLGHDGKVSWSQSDEALTVLMPAKPPCEHVVTLKIEGAPTK